MRLLWLLKGFQLKKDFGEMSRSLSTSELCSRPETSTAHQSPQSPLKRLFCYDTVLRHPRVTPYQATVPVRYTVVSGDFSNESDDFSAVFLAVLMHLVNSRSAFVRERFVIKRVGGILNFLGLKN